MNVINPLAAIAAGGMLLDEIGESEAGALIDQAIFKALDSGKLKSMAAGKMGLSTTEVGDLIASLV